MLHRVFLKFLLSSLKYLFVFNKKVSFTKFKFKNFVIKIESKILFLLTYKTANKLLRMFIKIT